MTGDSVFVFVRCLCIILQLPIGSPYILKCKHSIHHPLYTAQTILSTSTDSEIDEPVLPDAVATL